jgi:hypothetical protein
MLRARDTTTTTNLQFSFLWAGFQRPTDMAGDDLSGRNWRNGGPQQPTMPVIVPAQICARRGAMAAKGTYEIGEARTASWREQVCRTLQLIGFPVKIIPSDFEGALRNA